MSNEIGDDEGAPNDLADRADAPIVVLSADPDQAWKALALVNDWIKHAETKSIAVLAAAGVAGGVLYNLVKNLVNAPIYLNSAVIFCAFLLFSAGTAAALSLLPRLRLSSKSDSTTSPLYFRDIAETYGTDGPSYSDVLHALTGNPDELTRHIAHQVYANARVAHLKYRWANRALIAFSLGLTFLALTAILIGIEYR